MPVYEGKCQNDACGEKDKPVEFFSHRYVDVDQSTETFIGRECDNCREQMMRRVFGRPRIKVSMNRDELLARAMLTDMVENVPGYYDPAKHDGHFAPDFKRIIQRPDGKTIELGKESFGKSNLELLLGPDPSDE